jgi:hypothetical protein
MFSFSSTEIWLASVNTLPLVSRFASELLGYIKAVPLELATRATVFGSSIGILLRRSKDDFLAQTCLNFSDLSSDRR